MKMLLCRQKEKYLAKGISLLLMLVMLLSLLPTQAFAKDVTVGESDITEISNSGVTFADGKFAVPLTVTEFTFKDDGQEMVPAVGVISPSLSNLSATASTKRRISIPNSKPGYRLPALRCYMVLQYLTSLIKS